VILYHLWDPNFACSYCLWVHYLDHRNKRDSLHETPRILNAFATGKPFVSLKTGRFISPENRLWNIFLRRLVAPLWL